MSIFVTTDEAHVGQQLPVAYIPRISSSRDGGNLTLSTLMTTHYILLSR